MPSSVISFIFRMVSYVFKSEETDRLETSDVPIFRVITPLSIYTQGEVSSEKIGSFLKLSQEIPTSSPEICSFRTGLFGQRDW